MRYAIFFLGLFTMLNTLKAQTNLYNSGQLYLVNSTDTVFVSGSLYNSAGADLNNAGGNLFVKRDITNDQPSMTAGGGKFWTNGTVMQNFYGTNSFKTYNWIVDNTNDVTLQNKIELGNGTSGNLSFVNGKINSGTSLQDVLFNSGSTYTGYSDANHIIGYCSKDGNTNFTYPIGNGTLKADLDIANLGTSSVFQCKYFGTAYSSLLTTAPLISVFDREYWILDRISGTSGANITLKWNDARNALNHNAPSGLRVGHFTGSSWVSEGGVGTGNTATGSVTSIMVNSYSPFTFASESSLLPIILNSFTAVVTTNCSVNIKWSANEEWAIQKYYIQKFINSNWETIYTCLPKQMTGVSNYFYTDTKTHSGSNIYRVASENTNGKVNYTAVKSIKVKCGDNQILVYPTITTNYITVYLPENLNNSKLSVINSMGQVVFVNLKMHSGNQVIWLDEFSPGVYSIIIQNRDALYSYKVLKNY